MSIGVGRGKKTEASPGSVPWADNLVSFSINPGDTVSGMDQRVDRSDEFEQRDDAMVIRADEDNEENSDSNEAGDFLDNFHAFTQTRHTPSS